MQSGQDNQSTTPATPTQVTPISAEGILRSLKTGGSSPLEFIRNNLQLQPTKPVDPQALADKAKVDAEQKVSETKPSDDLDFDLDPKAADTQPTQKATDVKAAPTKVEDLFPKKDAATKPSSDTETDTTALEPQDTKEENFKALRNKLKEITTHVKDKEKELEEVSTKLKKYETGEELPEVLRIKEARIAELERYEKLHALKLSPAYKETYIKPIETIKNRLKEIAADYELPPEKLLEAINITNKKELNQFLSNSFDDVGAIEAKGLISQAQELSSKAQEAEKEPAKALETIEADFKNIQTERKNQAKAAIAETSKGAWVDSLLRIRQEGKIQELIPKEDDTDYNKKVVQPILQAAATEYGKIVRMLADSGLEHLPKDLAHALARMVHLAHASAVSVEARHAAEEEAQRMKESAIRTTRYVRPQVGGSGGGSGGNNDGPRELLTPQSAAKLLAEQVMGRR